MVVSNGSTPMRAPAGCWVLRRAVTISMARVSAAILRPRHLSPRRNPNAATLAGLDLTVAAIMVTAAISVAVAISIIAPVVDVMTLVDVGILATVVVLADGAIPADVMIPVGAGAGAAGVR